MTVQWHNKIKSLFRCRTTYSETTSEGKVWGTDRTFSHRALSLVQVHPAGHLGCLTLRPSARAKLTAATQTRSARPLQPLHPLPAPPGCPIFLLSRSSTVNPAHATYWPDSQRLISPDLTAKIKCCCCFEDIFFVCCSGVVALWCRLVSMLLASQWEGTSPADSFCKAQDYKCGTDGTWEQKSVMKGNCLKK